MIQKFLDGSNVVTVLQYMGRKRMPKGVGGHVLRQTGLMGRLMDRLVRQWCLSQPAFQIRCVLLSHTPQVVLSRNPLVTKYAAPSVND